MAGDLTSLTPHPQPHVDPDLPSGRAHGYHDVFTDLLTAARVAPWHECPAPGCTNTGDIHDRFCSPCWYELPGPLTRRLRRAVAAVDRCPGDPAVAAIYQARFAEAVAYLGSETQVAR